MCYIIIYIVYYLLINLLIVMMQRRRFELSLLAIKNNNISVTSLPIPPWPKRQVVPILIVKYYIFTFCIKTLTVPRPHLVWMYCAVDIASTSDGCYRSGESKKGFVRAKAMRGATFIFRLEALRVWREDGCHNDGRKTRLMLERDDKMNLVLKEGMLVKLFIACNWNS